MLFQTILLGYIYCLLGFFLCFSLFNITPTRQHPCNILLSASSLSSISQIYSIFHHHIIHSKAQHLFLPCKPIYSSPSVADGIIQCPKSARLSEWEWFITKREVFASVCKALQCKITSFIFHIAQPASLNIPVMAPMPCLLLVPAAINPQPFVKVCKQY